MNPSALLRILALLLVLAPAAQAGRPVLSWREKGRLLMTGTVKDSARNEYNVRIVPGYRVVTGYGSGEWSRGWSFQKEGAKAIARGLWDVPRALRHLGHYFTAEPWVGIGEGFVEGGRGARHVAAEFVWNGSGKAWSDYLGAAAEAHRRESFGWWLAYPWAAIKGAVNTTVRVAMGAVGVVACAAWALALRPLWELAYPLLMLTWDALSGAGRAGWGFVQEFWGLGVNQLLLGTSVPVVGWTWNTAVGLPVALFGRTPTPRSADGWWVAMLSSSPEIERRRTDERRRDARTGIPATARRLAYETRRRAAEDPIRARADSALERLDRQRDSIRQARTRQLDSVRLVFSMDLPERTAHVAEPPDYGSPPDSATLSRLLPLARRHVQADTLGAGLDSAQADSVAREIVRRWGDRLFEIELPDLPPDSTDGSGGADLPIADTPDAGRKFNPNRLLQEEIEQVVQ